MMNGNYLKNHYKGTAGENPQYFFISIVLLILYPILALPFIILGVSRNEKGAYICLALFMAMLGFLMEPTDAEDLSRIYAKFQYINSLSWSGQILFMWTQMDFFLTGLFILIGRLNIPKEFIPFISVLIGYLSFLLVFHHWSRNEKVKSLKGVLFSIFLVVFCMVSFRNYALNIRNFVAISALLVGSYQLFFLNKKRGWVFIALAPLCHLMAIIVIPFVAIAKTNISTKLCRMFFFISFVGILVNISAPINDYVLSLSFENEMLQTEQMTHFESGRYDNQSLGTGYNANGLIVMAFGYFVTLVMYYYMYRIKEESKIRNLVYLLMGLSNLLFHVSIMYSRYILIASAMFMLLLFDEIGNKRNHKFKTYFVNNYALLRLFLFLLSLYMTRESMGGCVRILSESPLFFLFK